MSWQKTNMLLKSQNRDFPTTLFVIFEKVLDTVDSVHTSPTYSRPKRKESEKPKALNKVIKKSPTISVFLMASQKWVDLTIW